MKKQNLIPLTDVIYAKKEFNYKVKVNCHYTGKCRGAAHSIPTLRCKTPKEIPVVFHIGSTYDYHFMSKS